MKSSGVIVLVPSLLLVVSLLLVLTGAVGCANDHDVRGPEIAIELEQTFESDQLGSATKAVVDDDGNLYVLDAERSAGRIVSFAPDGTTRWVLDERGEAPGELRWVRGLAWDGADFLYVDNQVGRRVDRFRLDGSFAGSTSLHDLTDSPIAVGGFVQPDKLVVWTSINGEFGARVLTIDVGAEPWRVVNSFTVIQTGEHSVLDGVALPPLVTTLDGKIAVGHLARYQYTMHNPAGDTTKIYERPRVRIEPPAVWQSGLGVSFTKPSTFYPLLRLSDQYLMGGGRWPARRRGMAFYKKAFEARQGTGQKKVNRLDVFDAVTGEPLRSLDAGDYGISELLASDREGRVYARLAGDTVRVGRFVLTIGDGTD